MFMSLVFGLIIILVGVLWVFQFILSSHSNMDSALTSLESGYENLKSNFMMSTPYFTLVVLFVIFDVELVLLVPFILNLMEFSLMSAMISMMLLLVIILSLMMEWAWLGLKWTF